MKKLRHIINGIIWTLMAFYVTLTVLTHLPPVQRFLGQQVEEALQEKLGTKVMIGSVQLGFLNRIIIDDVYVADQQHEDMLRVSRLSAKFDILPFLQGRVSIASAQLFGLKANLYRQKENGPTNFQFVVDSLASKDTTASSALDLSLGSVIIRRGQVKYNNRYVPTLSGRFSPHHIDLTNISAHVIVDKFTDDSLNIYVKKLAMDEHAGLSLHDLTLRLTADKSGAELKDLKIAVNNSRIELPRLLATYRYEQKQLKDLSYQCQLKQARIVPSDFKCLVPQLQDFNTPLTLHADIAGSPRSVHAKKLTVTSQQKELDIALTAKADQTADDTWQWNTDIEHVHFNADMMRRVAQLLQQPADVTALLQRIGDFTFVGKAAGRNNLKAALDQQDIMLDGNIKTEVGDVTFDGKKEGKDISLNMLVKEANLQQLLNDTHFGKVNTDLHATGVVSGNRLASAEVTGKVTNFDYNSYTYKELQLNGKYVPGTINGQLALNDPHAQVDLDASVQFDQPTPLMSLQLSMKNVNPWALHLLDKWPETTFGAKLEASLAGKDWQDMTGRIQLTDLTKESPTDHYHLHNFMADATGTGGNRYIVIESDLGKASITGTIDPAHLMQSISNQIGSQLPTLPGLAQVTKDNYNDFTLRAHIVNTDLLKHLFDIDLTTQEPISINGAINDYVRKINLKVIAPAFDYAGNSYKDAYVSMSSPADSLRLVAAIYSQKNEDAGTLLGIHATAHNNNLRSMVSIDAEGKQPMSGSINSETRFYKGFDHQPVAHIQVKPSTFLVGDTTWQVMPSDITYTDRYLKVNDFTIRHGNQHINIDGLATQHTGDTLRVNLQQVDVSYVLNLVNFHSVEFDGRATGQATLSRVFAKPQMNANIVVDQFTFEDGRMGVLNAQARWNEQEEQIDINAVANNGPASRIDINGYVSPVRNYIDLRLGAHHTNGEFLESFCGSFMRDVQVSIDGPLRLYGPLSNINLVGTAIADGTIGMKALGTTYNLHKVPVQCLIDEIRFPADTITDMMGHRAVVTGSIYHHNLSHLSYNLQVDADNLLAYDFKDFNGGTLCGTVFATGNCRIRGGHGELTIDVDVQPEKGTQINYDVASPSSVSNQEFIRWSDRDAVAAPTTQTEQMATQHTDFEQSSDLYINFLIRSNPNLTLKLLMDHESGDYIALNGNGVIHASYYNKGPFDMHGTYTVDHGMYKLTIQNVIKKDFKFQPDGTIVFGGDPFKAVINLPAIYTVNGVSLSDLNIGKSFSNNNIRVNCLMNITGTPESPKVTFDLDMPTVNSDAKQMIYSLINSEEEMNQQVIYLLAVGRFYSQANNNATADGEAQQSRTSLAMQSLLSGTLSQQINEVLSNVIKDNNFSVGANISTGDQGFYNAEYEGLLSGHLFNNRLLINGQFGYRDNPNATTSFIGDFDMRYLLLPNGNVAVRVYNQTNDRYFTRNSMNTQGLGLILKKDFNGLRNLFGIKKIDNGKSQETKQTQKTQQAPKTKNTKKKKTKAVQPKK